MKVTGFTIVRNAVKYDYPVFEAISSVLPLCDDFVVALGNSDDATEELIRKIDSNKIRIVRTVWDDTLREGGRVLAAETDKAFQAIGADTDWCFYIQADEILPDKYHRAVKEAMLANLNDTGVEGLLFNYKHFYGSYDYVGESFRWYRREIRVIRNDKSIFSYRDAQGFRKKPNEKLRVKLIDAFIYHYGWVRPPKAMLEKQRSFGSLYHGEGWGKAYMPKSSEFDYSEIDALSKFDGVHPAVMQSRIQSKNWKFDHDLARNKFGIKDSFKRFVEKLTGWRPGEYKNYKII
jgi:hypothetical protein